MAVGGETYGVTSYGSGGYGVTSYGGGGGGGGGNQLWQWMEGERGKPMLGVCTSPSLTSYCFGTKKHSSVRCCHGFVVVAQVCSSADEGQEHGLPSPHRFH